METMSNSLRLEQTTNLTGVKCEVEMETDANGDPNASKHFQNDHDHLLFFNDYDFSDHMQQPQQRSMDDDRVLATPPPSSLPDMSLLNSSGMPDNGSFSQGHHLIQANHSTSGSVICNNVVTSGLSVAVARVAPMAKLADNRSPTDDPFASNDLFGLCGGNAVCSQDAGSCASAASVTSSDPAIALNGGTCKQTSAKNASKMVPPKKPLTPYMRFSKMVSLGLMATMVAALVAVAMMRMNVSDVDPMAYCLRCSYHLGKFLKTKDRWLPEQ